MDMQRDTTEKCPATIELDDNAVLEQRSVLPRLEQQEARLWHITYHLYTLILFTYDQFFDTIIPGTIFGLLTALSGPALSLTAQPTLTVFFRVPVMFAWLWVIILQFCLQNQCSQGSWKEDAVNKPWRPIPSNRITLANAKKLLAVTNLLAATTSWYLSVSPPYFVWTALGLLYNDLGGSDLSGTVRNLFCGGFFTCSFGGALLIALNGMHLSEAAGQWTFLVCWCILMTTIQTQEFRDEIGDKKRARRTLVTELGRKRALWTVHIAVTFWSLYIPLRFFAGNWQLALLPVCFGGNLLITATRAMGENGRRFDRKMYKLWCLWMIAFFPLPLIKSILV